MKLNYNILFLLTAFLGTAAYLTYSDDEGSRLLNTQKSIIIPDVFGSPPPTIPIKEKSSNDVVSTLSNTQKPDTTYPVFYAEKEFFTTEDGEFSNEGATIKIFANSLTENTTISITTLCEQNVPILSPGMVNVTSGHKGFRFLPKGTTFSIPAEISLPYDKSLIPQGYTEEDIRTFYFDTETNQWVELPLDTVNTELFAVVSTTTHFTDMINGIIQVPESPETQAYTPTTLKDVKAADPSAGIVPIDPPQANNMGSANLSFPFKLPTGRAGMQPQLGLQYNSGGGNGWTGLGWNMSLPSVGIELQWGSPRFDASNETETYTLNGQQLFPLAHRGTLEPRTAQKTFYPRIEGAFDKIIRHGNSPKNYWWEVVDKRGTKSYYGGTPTQGVISSAVLKSNEDNIAHWALVETRDVHDNFVRYEYAIRQHAGVAGGTVQGRQQYIDRITYTGHGGTPGVYSVRFVPKSGTRPDVQIAGNLGFKQVTAELLEWVEVYYNTEKIRSYKLEYVQGAFFKTLLKSVAEYDADGELFYKNEFDYFDEVRSNGVYKPYSDEKTYSATGDGLSGGITVSLEGFRDKMSLLGGSKSWGVGGGGYVGFGVGVNYFTKNLTAGPTYNYSKNVSDGIVAMVDINGDGLPDKVFKKGSHLYFRPNLGGAGFGDQTPIIGIDEFSKSVSKSHDVGASVFAGPAHVGYSHSFIDNKVEVYFGDFNGDGLIDIVKNEKVYFNRLVDGVPTFSTNSGLTPSPIIGGGQTDSTLLPDTKTEQKENEAMFPLHDVVRVWEAQIAGTIVITAPINLVENTSEEALYYTQKDGVNVQIQHKANVLWQKRIEADDYATHYPTNVSSISVQKGDKIYFRVQSVFDGAYDVVDWNPEINYTAFADANLPIDAIDYNGKKFSYYKASDDFVLFGEQAIALPFDGKINVQAPLKKGFTGDTIWVRIEQRDSLNELVSVVFNQKYAPDEIIDSLISFSNFRVEEDQTLSFIVEAKTNILWENISWKPTAEYVSADDPQNVVKDDEGNPIIKFVVTPNYKGVTRLHYAAKSLVVKMYELPEGGDTNAFKDSILNLSKDTLRVFEGDSVKISSDIFVKSFYATLPVTSLTMVVRTSNDTIHISKNIPLQKKGDFFSDTIIGISDSVWLFPTMDDQIFVEYYIYDTVPENENNLLQYRDFISKLQPKFIVSRDTTLQTLPSALYGNPENLHLGAGYRGWGAFGYNGQDNNGTQLIDENVLKMPNRKAVENPENITEPETIDAGDPLSKDRFIMFMPVAEMSAWVGYDLSTYVTASQISSSRMGLKDVKVDDSYVTPIAGELRAWHKVSKGNSNGLAGGVSAGFFGVGASLAWGNSETTTDMIDLNGDGYPDLIRNGEIRYTGFDANLQTIQKSNFVHRSKNNAVGASSSGSVVTATGPNTSKIFGEKVKDAEKQAKNSISLSGNVGKNDDHVEHTYMDINGDGLQDRVYSDGRVALNLGYSFAEPENWGFTTIHSGSGNSYGGGLGVSLKHGSFQAGIGLSRSESRSESRLVDVNGDGLPDKIEIMFDPHNPLLFTPVVRLNTGNGFAEPIAWDGVYGAGSSVSYGQSTNFATTFGFPIFWGLRMVINPSTFGSLGRSFEESAFLDFDGDGIPDCVYSDSETEIKVKHSTIGKTNLLKSVKRPFGATFTLNYDRKGNTYDQPHSQWVLAEVKLFDGFVGDGVDSTFTTFEYEGGYYDRHERSFYGYGKVTTRQMGYGVRGAGYEEYRRVEQTFDNSNYYTKSVVQTETILAQNDTISHSVNRYELQDVLTGEILPAGFRTYDNGAAFVALRQTRNSQFEGTQKITSTQTFAYDLLGNVTTYIDFAAGNPADRIEVKITYHDNNSLYLKSIPKSQQVITPEGVLRQRETEIDGKGNITKITQNIDNTGNKAVYDFEYDNFGNLKKVTRPANYKGQRMFFEYEYDPVLNALPIKVKDAFGYESSSSYEYRFATLLQTTDLNNNQIFYTTDNRGRVSTITAPYETDAGKPYTIKFQYFTDRSLSGAEAYTITRHAMPEGNEVLTYTFVDGLMRPLQVKKTSSLFTGENQPDQKAMVVSGWNIYDGFGRVVETYQSVVENLGTETQINLSRNPIQPTRTTYDTRDRTTSTTLPDGATSTISYDLKIFPVLSVLDQLFEVTQTDPNGGIIKSYTDAKQRQRAMSQMLNGEDVFTISHYNALGEVLEVENTKGEKTKYVYDLLGRRLSVNHPDAGLTEFEYDNANNLLKKITPNLRAWSSRSLSGAEANAGADLQSVPSNFFIEYKYDFNRLMEIIYPKNVQNYVQYEYGEPNADHNRAGRLVLVQDASGGTEYFYDALGNITKTIRSILVSSSDLRTYVSEENYDSWGRIQKMIYPDGEVVNYEYNLAGNLRAMHSQKDGRTYEIIKQLGYNEDEQKVFKLLGNGTKTTYTYEPERKRLATMFAGKGNHVLFDNIYSYDLVDNITGIENNADVPMLNEGLGGATKNTYVYDEWNRLIFAKGSVETAKVRGTKEYELTMQYDKLYNITNKNQKVFHRSYNAGADLQSVPEQTHDFFYRYEDPNHPNAPTSIGSKNYQYDPNGNPIFIHDTATDAMRRMIWDEENRLILLSDDGNANNYIYDHAGERVIKAQATIQSVYIDGLPAGMLSSNKNHTIYVSPNMVARNDGFTKHYYAGTERVLSKLGGGTFNNRYSLTNQTITAGNKNYIQRMSQLQAGIDEHYKELQFPPGNPVFPNHAGQPEQTGNPIPTTPGTYEIPRGWPRDPITAPPGGPPGPPIQWGEPITNDNVTAGYTYRPNTLEEREQYFYHPDHLGSTSIITDKEGRATQFIAYLPFGEALVDEHTTRREMPFKFNGKEIDSETGLYYYGARYYDPRTAIWKGVDPLAEKYPNVGGYVYCINNPIRVIDPDGREIVIVGDEQYQATIKDYLNQLSASGKAGKFLVNQAIKSKRTFVIANTKDDVESNVLHKNKDATILTFNLSNQSTNLDEKNGGVAKSPLTSLAHELAHFNNPQDGRLLDAKGSGTSIPAGEVQAIEWENRVRKDLGMDERKMYNGIDVYGKEISPSQYKGFYNLQNKRGYGGNDGYSPINGIPKESLENRRTYQIQGQFFDRFLKNPQYKKQLRIKF